MILADRLVAFVGAVVLSVVLFAIPAHALLSKDTYRATNDVLYFNDVCSSGVGGGGGTTVQLAGSNNIEKLLNYLQAHGMTLEQASGVVGNAMWESGSKELDPKGSDGTAVGIAQWQGGRLTNLKKHGGDKWQEFDTQVEYIGVELGWEQGKNGAQSGLEAASLGPIKATSTPEEAALAWEHSYERSADTVGSDGWKYRQQYAREVYEKYKNGASAGSGNAQSMSANSSNGCSSAGAAGKVNADGYAFPIALSQSEVSNGYSWPCPNICHHDGSPAFDLSKKAQDDSTEGTPVIAIYNGTIQSFNNAYSGQSGCHAFQLVGDDGWWYWYGHLQASSVQDGSKVTAGQQISTVGRRACTGNGSYPHLHIDRGSPKGHYGGTVGARDQGMVPLINQLYDELGGGGGGTNPRDL